MGCDIHLHLEYKSRAELGRWEHFANPYIWRDYALFSAMAGVRQGSPKIKNFEPRGMPRDIDYTTLSDYTRIVLDHETEEEGCTSRERADGWAKTGTEWWDDKHGRIVGPDWHTPSWLTLPELKEAMKNAERAYHEHNIPIKVVVACMESFDREGCETRVVFWFDN